MSYVPENWDEVWAVSFGASYRYNDRLTLKGGYAYDESPLSDQNRTSRIPDTDRHWLTMGAKYVIADSWTIDAAYGYMIPEKGKLNEEIYYTDGTASGQKLGGQYEDVSAHVFSMSVTRRL